MRTNEKVCCVNETCTYLEGPDNVPVAGGICRVNSSSLDLTRCQTPQPADCVQFSSRCVS